MSHLGEHFEELVDHERREQERHRESGGVGREEHEAALEVGFIRRHREDRPEDRTDAGRPAGAEGDADHERAEVADRLVGDVQPRVAREQPQVEHAEHVETEDDDQHAADAADPIAIPQHDLTEHGRAGAEREEDQREAADEDDRVQERLALGMLEVLERHPRDEGDVARHERQHAGTQKAEQSGAESDEYAERSGGRFH